MSSHLLDMVEMTNLRFEGGLLASSCSGIALTPFQETLSQGEDALSVSLLVQTGSQTILK